MTTTDKLIKKYLDLDGKDMQYADFAEFHSEVNHAKRQLKAGSRNYICLEYIERKLMKGMNFCVQYGGNISVILEDTIEDIERGYDKASKEQKDLGKTKKAKASKKKQPAKKKKRNLGKLVDQGEVPKGGNADLYWGREKIQLVFKPDDDKVRHGEKVPGSYKYHDVRYLENYYNIKAFEFGNWLSQQDRVNYLSGLGLALFDLYPIIGFTPKQMSLKGKLTVSFGARGRGKAAAHFEPHSFVINLTRYGRPSKVNNRSPKFSRVQLMLIDGGIGAYAHEFAHALDCYAGTFIEKTQSGFISGSKSTDPKPHQPAFAKNSLRGLMETLLNKIIWKNKTTHSDYYKRLKKNTKGKYYFMRQEIFARAFEVYVQCKLAKKHYHNVFLNEKKYDTGFYLSLPEMKKLEKDFDALVAALKKQI